MLQRPGTPAGTLVAAAHVTDAGAFSGEVLGFSGVSGPVVNEFTLTLANAIDFQDHTYMVAVEGATRGSASASYVDAATMKVDTFASTGLGAARAFYVAVFRHAIGAGERP